MALRCREAQTVASSHKIDYVAKAKDIPKGCQNCIIGSKVTALFIKGWILTIGGVHREGS